MDLINTNIGPGGNLTLTPGKGSPGYSDGSIIFYAADGTELLTINADKTLGILGEIFSLGDIAKALSDFKSDKCRCPMKTLVATGCQCNGK